jgi:hypothetical protein
VQRSAGVETAYAGLLLAIPGAIAVATGQPLVFPSLGPSAYLLATRPFGEGATARRVVGGHAVGVLAGLVAYWSIAPGLVITTASPPVAGSQSLLVASAVASVALTTAGMAATETRHAPACATTLIVSLGLLARPVEAGGIVASVAVLYGVHAATRKELLQQ